MVALDRTTVMGCAVLDASPVHISDIQNAGDNFLHWAGTYRQISASRDCRRPIDAQSKDNGRAAAAAQRVIAVKNTRLFEVEQASLPELTKNLSAPGSSEKALSTIYWLRPLVPP